MAQVIPIPITPVILNTFQAEYLIKGSDLIYHFFRRDNTPWPHNFRELIRSSMIQTWRLQDRQDQLIIEWIPELFSWCVRIAKIATISEPPRSSIERSLQIIDSQQIS